MSKAVRFGTSSTILAGSKLRNHCGVDRALRVDEPLKIVRVGHALLTVVRRCRRVAKLNGAGAELARQLYS